MSDDDMTFACYEPTVNEGVDLFPCDEVGDLNSCCTRGDSCSSNGLCVRSENAKAKYYFRGCTDSDWSNCNTECRNSSGTEVKACSEGKFCCMGDSGCNCEKDELFDLDPVRIIGDIPTDADWRTGRSSASLRAEADAETTTAEPEDNGGSNHALPIGLGVGLGVGIPLLILAAAFIWFVKRRTKRAAGATEEAAQPAPTTAPKPDAQEKAVQYTPVSQEMPTPEPPKLAVSSVANGPPSKEAGRTYELDNEVPRAELP